MKILMLNHEFPPVGGGASPVCFELSRQLVQMGHQVDVVTMRFKQTPVYEECEGIHIYRTPALRKYASICRTHEMATYIPGSLFTIHKLIKSEDYDIIHCHFIIPGGILAQITGSLYKVPYIITAHGSDVPGYNPDRFNIQHKFTRPLLRSICRSAKAIVSPSFYLRDLILDNIGDYDVKKIPNGIDFSVFQLDLTRPKEPIVLTTGRLLKRKGFHTLIDAVREVKLGFEIHIVGDGPCKDELEVMAAGSKTPIVFHGWLNRSSWQFRSLYEKAKIFVLVSQRENASVSLLEGMAARCAVITTNVTGCPETVGDSGFLIDYGDAKSLRSILEKLISDPHMIGIYAEKAHERVINEFAWSKIAKQYLEVYGY